MKRRISIFPLALVSLLATTSCVGGSDWNTVGSSDTINYCLLIGQLDHNDSSARTAGIRDVLGTRDIDGKRSNPNTENPIVNEDFYTDSKGRKYRIREIEHGEQKSTSGATWDQQTANETATLWINKHYANSWTGIDGKKKNGQSISMFVSNNDGMAMGALGSVRWVTGMPIFGYDANTDALNAIKEGRVTGTVDQCGTGQAAGIYMVARNLIDHVGDSTYTINNAITDGFGEANQGNYGYVKSTFQPFNSTTNAHLVQNIAVTKANVDDFLIDKASDKLAKNERIKAYSGGKTANIYQSYYSSTDNFLNSTMKPLFEELMGSFNFKVDSFFGNGNDEAKSLDDLSTGLNKEARYDAFIINMVKTTSTQSYLDKIYNAYKGSDNKVHTPIIFWNRQPTTQTNEVDVASMKDNRFDNIVYVGFDAIQGGQVQGQMIKDYIIAEIEASK